jgi:hypothetical protein
MPIEKGALRGAAAPDADRRRQPGDRPASPGSHHRGVRPRVRWTRAQDGHHSRCRVARTQTR